MTFTERKWMHIMISIMLSRRYYLWLCICQEENAITLVNNILFPYEVTPTNSLSRRLGRLPERGCLPSLWHNLKNCFRRDVAFHGHLLLLQINVKRFNTCSTLSQVGSLVNQRFTGWLRTTNHMILTLCMIKNNKSWSEKSALLLLHEGIIEMSRAIIIFA